MPRARVLRIAGESVKPGESRDIHLALSESYLGAPMTLPLSVLRARQEGPVVALTGAIHGDELNGVGILRELMFGDPLPLVRGTVVFVPVVNVFGLENFTRYLPDRRDLNRSFPGSPTGSLTSRLAHTLFSEIVARCDYCIDFHSAAVRRTNYPNVRGDMRNPGVRAIARSFGCELIVNSRGPEDSLRRVAVRKGIPTIILEAGEVWKIEPGVVAIGVQGVWNVLRSLGMIEGSPVRPYFQVTVEKTVWARAERGGFLGFHARPGDLVQEGQDLATNYSIFGREQNILASPATGIVLGMTTMPAVKPGEPVYHLAVLAQQRFRQIRKRILNSSDETLFHRLRDDLSTNITIQERNGDTGEC